MGYIFQRRFGALQRLMKMGNSVIKGWEVVTNRVPIARVRGRWVRGEGFPCRGWRDAHRDTAGPEGHELSGFRFEESGTASGARARMPLELVFRWVDLESRKDGQFW